MIEIKKKICRRCTRYGYNRGDLYCMATAKTITHYSTGKSEVVYTACDVVNAGGHCSMFVYQPTVWETIRPWLYKFNWLRWLVVFALIAAAIMFYIRST